MTESLAIRAALFEGRENGLNLTVESNCQQLVRVINNGVNLAEINGIIVDILIC